MAQTNTSCCLKMPVAILEPVLDNNGVLTAIENVSQYNDADYFTALRRAEWYIFKNSQVVYTFGFGYLNAPLSIGGNRALMALAQGPDTVYDFLAANHIQSDSTDIIEIAALVINSKKYRSGLSNKIRLGAITDCCDDDDLYELVLNGTNYCATSPTGDCYVQPIIS